MTCLAPPPLLGWLNECIVAMSSTCAFISSDTFLGYMQKASFHSDSCPVYLSSRQPTKLQTEFLPQILTSAFLFPLQLFWRIRYEILFFFFFLQPPVKYCAMEGVTQILHHCSNTRNEILYLREITEKGSKSISVFYSQSEEDLKFWEG